MGRAAVLSAVAEACPSMAGRQFARAASEYSALAGLLAGFAFTALVFILREGVSGRFARAVEVLVFAFFGLVLASANYAVISGEEERYAAGRAVSEAVFAGGALTMSGILLLYAIILLLDAVERSADETSATGAVDKPRDGSARANGVGDEGDFGRVKRHLSAITATLVTFVVVVIVTPGAAIYSDVTNRPVVEMVAWGVLVAQLVLSSVVGVAYLLYHRSDRRFVVMDWSGTSRFGLVSLGFVLVSTLACQWAGTIPACDQVHWLPVAGAVVVHGVLMGYATIAIGSPWLRLRRS